MPHFFHNLSFATRLVPNARTEMSRQPTVTRTSVTIPWWARILAALLISWHAFEMPQAQAARPRLSVKGNKLVDPMGRSVFLRGLSSMGMGMVYGDKARPGGYLPMTPTQYIDRAVQTDATGNKWHSTAIRLV